MRNRSYFLGTCEEATSPVHDRGVRVLRGEMMWSLLAAVSLAACVTVPSKSSQTTSNASSMTIDANRQDAQIGEATTKYVTHEYFSIGPWEGGAYGNDSPAQPFEGCFMRMAFENGAEVSIIQERDRHYQIVVLSQDLKARRRGKVIASYAINRERLKDVLVYGHPEGGIYFDYPGGRSTLFDAFRSMKRLVLVISNQKYTFDMPHGPDVIRRVDACYKKWMAKEGVYVPESALRSALDHNQSSGNSANPFKPRTDASKGGDDQSAFANSTEVFEMRQTEKFANRLFGSLKKKDIEFSSHTIDRGGEKNIEHSYVAWSGMGVEGKIGYVDSYAGLQGLNALSGSLVDNCPGQYMSATTSKPLPGDKTSEVLSAECTGVGGGYVTVSTYPADADGAYFYIVSYSMKRGRDRAVSKIFYDEFVKIMK